MQHVQEVAADGIIPGVLIDAPAVPAEMVPVSQHGRERSQQPVGDITGFPGSMLAGFRRHGAQQRATGPEDIHGRDIGRQQFQAVFNRVRQAAQRGQFHLVPVQFRPVGQALMQQQVRDLLKFTGLGDIQYVVAAIGQVVAAAAYGAQGGIPGRHARQGDRFLRFSAHCGASSRNRASSFRSYSW